jgi:hypothetical protein
VASDVDQVALVNIIAPAQPSPLSSTISILFSELEKFIDLPDWSYTGLELSASQSLLIIPNLF